MIWFGIALLVAIIWGLVVATDDDPFMGLMAFFFAAFIGSFAAFFVSMLVGLNLYEKDTYSYSFDVVAAKDGSATEGRFSIFGGFIDEKPYYFFYRQGEDGGISQGRVPTTQAKIYEDQETKNFIEVTKCDSHLWFWGLIDGCEPTYEIHVPKGSVKRDVEFDLE